MKTKISILAIIMLAGVVQAHTDVEFYSDGLVRKWNGITTDVVVDRGDGVYRHYGMIEWQIKKAQYENNHPKQETYISPPCPSKEELAKSRLIYLKADKLRLEKVIADITANENKSKYLLNNNYNTNQLEEMIANYKMNLAGEIQEISEMETEVSVSGIKIYGWTIGLWISILAIIIWKMIHYFNNQDKSNAKYLSVVCPRCKHDIGIMKEQADSYNGKTIECPSCKIKLELEYA